MVELKKSQPGDADQNESESRYTMLNPIHGYAEELLEGLEDNERTEVQRRHAEYYLSVAKKAERLPEEQLIRLYIEYPNLQKALKWCCESSEARFARLGLELTVALGWFWEIRNQFSESLGHLEAFLGTLERTQGIGYSDLSDDIVQFQLLLVVAYVRMGKQLWRENKFLSARRKFDKGVAIAKQLDEALGKDSPALKDKFHKEVIWALGFAYAGLGLVTSSSRVESGKHPFDIALQHFNEILKLEPEPESERGRAARWDRAYVRFLRGARLDDTKSVEDLKFALGEADKLNVSWGRAQARLYLGYALLKGLSSTKPHDPIIESYFAVSRYLFIKLRDARGRAWSLLGASLTGLAKLLLLESDNNEEARNKILAQLEEGYDLFCEERVHDPRGLANIIGAFGIIAYETQDQACAARWFGLYDALHTSLSQAKGGDWQGKKIPLPFPFWIIDIPKYKEYLDASQQGDYVSDFNKGKSFSLEDIFKLEQVRSLLN